MKTKTVSGMIAAALACISAARADQLNLRYEWSATPAGPYAPLSPEMTKVHADGSVTVATGGPQGFFRLVIDNTSSGGGSASVPVLPLETVPKESLEMIRKYIIAISEDGTEEGANWKGATFAPFVTPLVSASSLTGEPDVVEIKVLGPCDPKNPAEIFPDSEGERRSRERGFIQIGLSRKLPPLIGYSADGPTQTEQLLEHCGDGAVKRIWRFGPMFLAGEGADGKLVGNLGLYPAIFPDETYEGYAKPLNFEWDSEAKENPPIPERPASSPPMTFRNFNELLTAYRKSAFLDKRRKQREALIEFDWLTLEGKAPSLQLKSGERKAFLTGESFTRFWLDDEDERQPPVVSLTGAAGGIAITGDAPGAYRLTLLKSEGDLVRYMVVVTGAGPVLRNHKRDDIFGSSTTTTMWEAGNRDAQPRFSQRSDLDRWCPAVGCGPVMLAIQIAWAEHNQDVPSAYWNRDPNASLSSRRASLRQVESPMEYWHSTHNNVRMMQWYDYLHDKCDVACWAGGSGSALPWDVSDTLINYTNYVCGPFLPLNVAQDLPQPLCGGHTVCRNDVLGDDWDDAGTLVANAIKAGRPGGVYYMEHWHYAVAWRYRKTTTKHTFNGVVVSTHTTRQFRVNTGWGDSDAVWNAYDIDGGYTLNLWQKRLPPQ